MIVDISQITGTKIGQRMLLTFVMCGDKAFSNRIIASTISS